MTVDFAGGCMRDLMAFFAVVLAVATPVLLGVVVVQLLGLRRAARVALQVQLEAEHRRLLAALPVANEATEVDIGLLPAAAALLDLYDHVVKLRQSFHIFDADWTTWNERMKRFVQDDATQRLWTLLRQRCSERFSSLSRLEIRSFLSDPDSW